jgi:hypothetical protein
MDNKKNSKKKASNTTTPANQSLLAFNAPPPLMNSPIVRPPYDKGDKVATTFQLAFTLLELAQLGDIAVHRAPGDDAKHHVAHCHTFTQRGHLLVEAKSRYATEYNAIRNT